MLAPLDGVIAAGINVIQPNGGSELTAWRWESGIIPPLLSTNTNTTTSISTATSETNVTATRSRNDRRRRRTVTITTTNNPTVPSTPLTAPYCVRYRLQHALGALLT